MRGAVHHRVDIAVVQAVKGVCRPGCERPTHEHCDCHLPGGKTLCSQEHRWNSGDQQKFYDPRLGEGDVRSDVVPERTPNAG
jgi:hypothetical protein